MSHKKVIAITISIGILLTIVPFLAYTQQKPTITRKEPIKAKPLNTITYISIGISGLNLVENLFESKQFTGKYFDNTILSSPKKIYDIHSDHSIEKYVSRTISLNNKKYIPKDMIILQSDYLTTSQKRFQLRADAATELISMAQEFYEIFNNKIVIISAYRSYGHQATIKKGGCPDTLCAPAGHSEHQLGLAIDIFAASTADKFLSKADFSTYYTWLVVNAHRYGWHNTYQKGVKIDSYQVEPRHRRYLGRELATELFERKMTLGEWVKEMNK